MQDFKKIKTILAAAATAALLAACSTTAPTIQTGPDAEVTFDGLNRVDNSQADIAWARPDFDISQYTKIMLVGAGVHLQLQALEVAGPLGGGLGLGYLHSTTTTDAAEALDIHDIRSDLLAGAVGQIGVTYRAGPSWMLNFDVKYNGASGDVELEDAAGDAVYTLKTDLDSWLVGIGAAYRFR